MTNTQDARANVCLHSLCPRTTSVANAVTEKEQCLALTVILVMRGHRGPERFIPAKEIVERLPSHCSVAGYGNEHNRQAGTPSRGSGPDDNLLDIEELERQLRRLLINSPSGPGADQGTVDGNCAA